jgi:signal transduction histidine kinase
MESGRSLLIDRVDTDTITSMAHDAHHAAELGEILHSYMIVPLMVERKAMGVIEFIACQPNAHFDDINLAAAEELGRLSALAIENARYAEKLRQAIQIREDVVAIVSHDLRSPLAVILQSCELLLKRLNCDSMDSSNALCKLVNLASTAGRRMQELIADLLDLAHLESGHFVLKQERIEPASFIRETLDLLSPIATKKGVLLTADLPIELPMLKADHIRLTQILTNLLSNAIKHTPAAGTVEVGARLRDDGWIEFSVNDSGCGIPKENLPVLFDRYWKPDDSRDGYGLGLFVVKGIVEAHGGSIHVTSEENKGTCFSFILPTILVGLEQKNTDFQSSNADLFS